MADTIKAVTEYASLDRERFASEIQSHIEDRQTAPKLSEAQGKRKAERIRGTHQSKLSKAELEKGEMDGRKERIRAECYAPTGATAETRQGR